MHHPQVLSTVALCIFLTACVSSPTITLTPVEVGAKLRQAQVTVLPIDKPVQLSERTKAQAVGNFVIASVLSSAAGSAGTASNPQQFQAQTRIAQDFGNNLSKTLPTSYAVASGTGADLALAKKISDYFAQRKPSPNPANSDITIAVSAQQWELGYTSFLGSQDYALSYRLLVSMQEKVAEQSNHLKTVDCTATAPEKMPLEQWQANDYAALNTSAQAIVDACFKRFLQYSGLNDTTASSASQTESTAKAN